MHRSIYSILIVAISLMVIFTLVSTGCSSESSEDGTQESVEASSGEASTEAISAEESLQETSLSPPTGQESASPAPSPAPVPSSSLSSPSAPQSSLSESGTGSSDQSASAKVGGTISGSPPSVDNGEYLGNIESEILTLFNEERASLGLEPVELMSELRTAARIRSGELYVNDYFAHTRPNGNGWQTVLNGMSYTGAGEILANNSASGTTHQHSAREWFNQWKNSPGHYAIIKTPEFRYVGIGVLSVQNANTSEEFATALFLY